MDRENDITPPLDINDPDMRVLAARHFNGVQLPTPFISVRESLLPAVHAMLKSPERQAVVIDLRIAEEAIKRAFPAATETIFMAPWLVSRLDLQLPKNYKGFTEHLVYGFIPREACVASLSAIDLQHFRQRYPRSAAVLQMNFIETTKKACSLSRSFEGTTVKLDSVSGEAVGNFLSTWTKPPPIKYVEAIALKIARAWKLDGYRAMTGKEAFLDAVSRAFTKSKADIDHNSLHDLNVGDEEDVEFDDSEIEGGMDGPWAAEDAFRDSPSCPLVRTPSREAHLPLQGHTPDSAEIVNSSLECGLYQLQNFARQSSPSTTASKNKNCFLNDSTVALCEREPGTTSSVLRAISSCHDGARLIAIKSEDQLSMTKEPGQQVLGNVLTELDLGWTGM